MIDVRRLTVTSGSFEDLNRRTRFLLGRKSLPLNPELALSQRGPTVRDTVGRLRPSRCNLPTSADTLHLAENGLRGSLLMHVRHLP